MAKLITKTDANLITLQYQDFSEEALNANELLIKQLIFILKSNGQLITEEDQQKIENYQVLNGQVSELLAQLEINTLPEISTLLSSQSEIMDIKDEQLIAKEIEMQKCLDELRQKNEEEIIQLQLQHQQKCTEYEQTIKKLETNIEKLEDNIEQLTKKSEKYKQQYEEQKNRKVVRFVDKVARR